MSNTDVIVPGIVVFIRTTDEPVFVLDVVPQENSLYPSLDATKAIVRRPILTKDDGIAHNTDHFFLAELETFSQRLHRVAAQNEEEQAAMRETQRKFQALPKDAN
jgi:hypothetical protein